MVGKARAQWRGCEGARGRVPSRCGCHTGQPTCVPSFAGPLCGRGWAAGARVPTKLTRWQTPGARRRTPAEQPGRASLRQNDGRTGRGGQAAARGLGERGDAFAGCCDEAGAFAGELEDGNASSIGQWLRYQGQLHAPRVHCVLRVCMSHIGVLPQLRSQCSNLVHATSDRVPWSPPLPPLAACRQPRRRGPRPTLPALCSPTVRLLMGLLGCNADQWLGLLDSSGSVAWVSGRWFIRPARQPPLAGGGPLPSHTAPPGFEKPSAFTLCWVLGSHAKRITGLTVDTLRS